MPTGERLSNMSCYYEVKLALKSASFVEYWEKVAEGPLIKDGSVCVRGREYTVSQYWVWFLFLSPNAYHVLFVVFEGSLT